MLSSKFQIKIAFKDGSSYFLRTSTFLILDFCFETRCNTSNVNGLFGRSKVSTEIVLFGLT